MSINLSGKFRSLRNRLRIDPLKVRRLRDTPTILRAGHLLGRERQSILFVTSLLRAREIKIADALRCSGWKIVLIYIETTPFKPENSFDIVLRVHTESEAHHYAKLLGPRICHVFSGAVDGLIYRFCADKPGPIVVDMNDIFCPSLFSYCEERFEPTRDCLERADGLCSRDLQAKSAERIDSFRLPRHTILFPEYSYCDGPQLPGAVTKLPDDEVHVVSVGTFTLEKRGMFDSGYLKLAEMLTDHKVHLHIYPHWFYRKASGSSFNWSLEEDFADFIALQKRTSYLHIHESLPLQELAKVLPQYDFGIVAGGCEALGQKLELLKRKYMEVCYSGRISDYLDARLPVLINQEVAFDFWLLKRYGLAVDLAGIHQPDYQASLLAIKHDRRRKGQVESAARKLSISANIDRLTTFYNRIIDETSLDWARLGYPWSLAMGLPKVGGAFRHLESEYRRLNRNVQELRAELERERAKAKHQSKLKNAAGDSPTHAPEISTSILDLEYEAARPARNMLKAKRSLEVERGSNWADELHGLLNWSEIRDKAEQTSGMPELVEMIELFSSGTESLNQISSCWQVLGYKNFNQLLRDGYRNFKRTVGCSYFNFLIQSGDPQIATLESILDPVVCKICRQIADSLPNDTSFKWEDQKAYRYFVLLLWKYTQSIDSKHYLSRLEEPEEGNPIVVPDGSIRASQDLANSLIEYYAITERVDLDKCNRVLEIGGGYGRDAFVILELNPHIQYTLVDIPPALWIAQRYLSSIFPDRKVFRVRDFKNYDDVKEEMNEASIVCLLPHQLEMLPDRHFELSLNISSFGEMQPAQIKAYLEALERLTKGYFYMKQWRISQNAFDHLALTEDNYPISRRWKKVYSRTCPVQNAFFESLYSVGK